MESEEDLLFVAEEAYLQQLKNKVADLHYVLQINPDELTVEQLYVAMQYTPEDMVTPDTALLILDHVRELYTEYDNMNINPSIMSKRYMVTAIVEYARDNERDVREYIPKQVVKYMFDRRLRERVEIVYDKLKQYGLLTHVLSLDALLVGVKVELEHGPFALNKMDGIPEFEKVNNLTNVTDDNLFLAAAIALAHYEEGLNYYKYLKEEVELKLEKENKGKKVQLFGPLPAKFSTPYASSQEEDYIVSYFHQLRHGSSNLRHIVEHYSYADEYGEFKVRHCSHDKHRINTNYVRRGIADMEDKFIEFRFREKCNDVDIDDDDENENWYHMESGEIKFV